MDSAIVYRGLSARATFKRQEIRMNRRLWLFSLLAAFLIPTAASAQKLERTTNWAVGDRATYDYVRKYTRWRLIEEIKEVDANEIRSTVRVGDRIYDTAYSTLDHSKLRGICAPSGQQCSFSPGWMGVAFPLEKGKTWSFKATVKGETFLCEESVEISVVGVESVSVPAGRFDAFRATGTTLTTCGNRRGTAHFTSWVTAIKGKAVLVKSEYANSFGETATAALESVELK